MPELELNPQKVYKMPDSLFTEAIDNQFLVIARDSANWLLLRNEQQLQIFRQLASGKSVLNVFTEFSKCYPEDLYAVLVELEAKQFENTETNHPQEDGIYIYLTNRCNQKCHHCYMFAGNGDCTELSTAEVLELLNIFSKAGGKVVTFTGGEATLHPGFKSIVSHAKKSGLRVGVLTNGLLWTQEFIDAVKESVDEVQVSIDGFDPESYARVRGMDVFNRVLEAVGRLADAGLRVTVAITPLLETLMGNEERYAKFAASLIEKYQDKEFFVKFNPELLDGRDIAPSKADNEKYHSMIQKIKSQCATCSEEEDFAIDHIHNTIFNNCGYGGITIASNGDVYFCNQIPECAKQANIRTHDFNEIMSLSRKARIYSDIDNLLPCKDCPLKYLCGGGCRVKFFRKLVLTDISSAPQMCYMREEPCTKEKREAMYRLMIRASHLFYQ